MNNKKSSFFGSVRGKFILTGVLGVIAALIIGVVGVTSISRNSKNSEIVALVDEISVKQAENLANDALYQYYVEKSYIDTTIDNLSGMNTNANKLKSIADASYSASVNSIIENINKGSANYAEILNIHNSRG